MSRPHKFKDLGIYRNPRSEQVAQEMGVKIVQDDPRATRMFFFGSVHGLYLPRVKFLPFTLVCVVNERMGNGDFAKLMDFLEDRHATVRIVSIFNDTLMDHLITKRGYVALGPDQVEKKSGPTRGIETTSRDVVSEGIRPGLEEL